MIQSAVVAFAFAFGSGLASAPEPDAPEPLAGSAQLIETRAGSEKAFRHDIVRKGLFAVVLRLTNSGSERTFRIDRRQIGIQTEFDARLQALAPQRAYDRLMRKVAGGLGFAEAGIARAITEGAEKRKLKQTVLARSWGDSLTLGPGQRAEGSLFFELPSGAGSMRFAELSIEEIVTADTGERFALRLPLNLEP